MNNDKYKLGELLVNELEDNNDMISKWMAYYIGEQMNLARNSIGIEKEKAEQRCFENILKLWDRRAELPNNKYPFKNLDSTFQVIERINPENDNFFYMKDELPNYSNQSEVSEYLSMIKNIDKVSRISISFILKNIAKEIIDESILNWSDACLEHLNGNFLEISIINKLLNEEDVNDGVKIKKSIEKRVAELKEFQVVSNRIIEMYNKQLDMKN